MTSRILPNFFSTPFLANLAIIMQLILGIILDHVVQHCNEGVLLLSPFTEGETKAPLLKNLPKEKWYFTN